MTNSRMETYAMETSFRVVQICYFFNKSLQYIVNPEIPRDITAKVIEFRQDTVYWNFIEVLPSFT
jgi:hypothetical protein